MTTHPSRYASGYLGTQDEPLARSPALTTAKGDVLLEALLNGARFDSVRVGPLGGRLPRPEPRATQGAHSSLSGNPGTAGGPRKAHWARDYIR